MMRKNKELRQRIIDTIKNDTRTITNIAEHLGYSNRYIGRVLGELLDEGRVTRVKCREGGQKHSFGYIWSVVKHPPPRGGPVQGKCAHSHVAEDNFTRLCHLDGFPCTKKGCPDFDDSHTTIPTDDEIRKAIHHKTILYNRNRGYRTHRRRQRLRGDEHRKRQYP
jgi:hypothetical protein